MTIRTLEQALDHADLVSDCVSTSAKALKILAVEVRRLTVIVNLQQQQLQMDSYEGEW